MWPRSPARQNVAVRFAVTMLYHTEFLRKIRHLSQNTCVYDAHSQLQCSIRLGRREPPLFRMAPFPLKVTHTYTYTHTHTYSSTLCIVERIKGLHRHADMLDLTQAHGRYCIYIQPGTIKGLRAFSAFLGAKRILRLYTAGYYQ